MEPPGALFEFTTTIRGRDVTCRLEDGRLHGDPELLRRVALVVGPEETLDPASVARVLTAAVGSEVTIHVRDQPTGP